MDLVVYDDDEKRYVPWAVALVGVLLIALLAAGLTFLLARRASGAQDAEAVGGVSSPAPATGPDDATASAAPSASSAAGAASPPACRTALERADAALERSVAIERALAAHTDVVDELLAERIGTQEALDRSLPVLTEGATERGRFAQDLEAYRAARGQCSG